MTQAGKSFLKEEQFQKQLARKLLLIFIPAIIVPITIFGVITIINSNPEDVGRIILLFSVLFVMGCSISYGFNWFVKKQIVQPIHELTEVVHQLGHGNFEQGLQIQRDDELGSLAFTINNTGKKITNFQKSLEFEIASLKSQMQISADLIRIAKSALNITEILQRSVDLIVERFHHYHAAIYILDPVREILTPQVTAGEATKIISLESHTIEVTADSIISWTLKNNKSHIAPKVEDDPLYLPLPGLFDSKSEAAFPISTEKDVLGVLDLHDIDEDAFPMSEVKSLQSIIEYISEAIQYFQISDNTNIDPHITSLFFEASHLITRSETVEAVFSGLKNVLRGLPFPSIFFLPENSELSGEILVDQEGQSLVDRYLESLPVPATHLADFIPDIYPISLTSLKQQREYLPDLLVTFFQEIEFNNLTLYPMYLESNLAALLFFGTVDEEPFSTPISNAITNLIEITKTSLERVTAVNTITERFTELQTLYAVSQSISTETNLNQLYEVIHQQVVNVMGDINFLIALYSEDDSTIEIPYMDDGEEIISVPPFPLGQGLTSIIIRTRQPLMIVEDTINRSRALGAIVTGDKPALSWLGVPIIAGKDILGAIVVQDLAQEHRFNEDDMLLLTTLAAQIAISVRNTKLMEETRRLADHERAVSEISSKISQSIDIENILKTAVRELGKLPNVTDASIHLRAPRER